MLRGYIRRPRFGLSLFDNQTSAGIET